MADVLVSTVVRTILGNLTSLALCKFEIASSLKSELENLEGTLSNIQAVLQDAEQKQWRSEAVKNWLRKLKEVAYDADDILNEFTLEALKWRARRNMCSQVSDFFSSQNSTVFNFRKAHKLKLVRQRLDAVAEEKNKFHLTEKVGDVEIDDSEWRQTSSLTTLAQLVYNDERVERAFDLRIWVCLSDDFEVRGLTKAIIESIDGSPSNIQELDTLQQQLQEKLRGKMSGVKTMKSGIALKIQENDWLSVKEREIWELPDDRSSILPALRLSYDDLPSYLRQCFAYCSIFPKDNEMDKSQLIELWIENGFVPPRGQGSYMRLGMRFSLN
ncbi:hypothetical protein CRYUN_Cryun23aG0017600 [Craigia yunnanensis]